MADYIDASTHPIVNAKVTSKGLNSLMSFMVGDVIVDRNVINNYLDDGYISFMRMIYLSDKFKYNVIDPLVAGQKLMRDNLENISSEDILHLKGLLERPNKPIGELGDEIIKFGLDRRLLEAVFNNPPHHGSGESYYFYIRDVLFWLVDHACINGHHQLPVQIEPHGDRQYRVRLRDFQPGRARLTIRTQSAPFRSSEVSFAYKASTFIISLPILNASGFSFSGRLNLLGNPNTIVPIAGTISHKVAKRVLMRQEKKLLEARRNAECGEIQRAIGGLKDIIKNTPFFESATVLLIQCLVLIGNQHEIDCITLNKKPFLDPLNKQYIDLISQILHRAREKSNFYDFTQFLSKKFKNHGISSAIRKQIYNLVSTNDTKDCNKLLDLLNSLRNKRITIIVIEILCIFFVHQRLIWRIISHALTFKEFRLSEIITISISHQFLHLLMQPLSNTPDEYINGNELLYNLSIVAYDNGNLLAAEKFLDRLSNTESLSLLPCRLMAKIHFKNMEYKEAIIYAKKVLLSHNHDPEMIEIIVLSSNSIKNYDVFYIDNDISSMMGSSYSFWRNELFKDPSSIQVRLSFLKMCIICKKAEISKSIMENICASNHQLLVSSIIGPNNSEFELDINTIVSLNNRLNLCTDMYQARVDLIYYNIRNKIVDKIEDIVPSYIAIKNLDLTRARIASLVYAGRYDVAIEDLREYNSLWESDAGLLIYTIICDLRMKEYDNVEHIFQQLKELELTYKHEFDYHLCFYIKSCLSGDYVSAIDNANKLLDKSKFSRISLSHDNAFVAVAEARAVDIHTKNENIDKIYNRDRELLSVYLYLDDDFDDIKMSIDSILSQKYYNFEIIIIYDGVNDMKQKELLDLEYVDTRIKIILNTTKRGSKYCLKLALLHARGEIIIFHGSADWSHPNRLECIHLMYVRDPECPILKTEVFYLNYNSFFTSGSCVLHSDGDHLSFAFNRKWMLEKIELLDKVSDENLMNFINELIKSIHPNNLNRLYCPLVFRRQ
ncbi:glycosyltransferase family A protein [Ancylobacter oerskovii]|uniref:Glycosyltransferase family A protein n=1 Tax=Ancylobacter oerskovii TaxID=459519 RepID=A0ABW4Z4X2_9HYPH|nr:glycosyltransferase family A protein [Ancylobacter oerskovii]MBS7543794.1 glycosyltransferase family 2 protein [Ancylobacter oerskovii]